MERLPDITHHHLGRIKTDEMQREMLRNLGGLSLQICVAEESERVLSHVLWP